jgi:predicted DNA-binding transcriptional regulator YafY
MVTFRADKNIIGHIVDWLGKDVTFTEIKEDSIVVSVRVNLNAMLYWALQYGNSVEILSPETLRNSVRDVVSKMWGQYG